MTARIALRDFAAIDAELGDELRAAVSAVAKSGRFILGEVVADFEAAMAQHHGVPEAVALASGTDALILTLEASGIGAGDRVVTTPLSFVATSEAILRVGAEPCFVDVTPEGGMSPTALATGLDRLRAAGEPAAAVLPTHLFGRSADGLVEVAAAHRIPVIHDAAQAVGARIEGRPSGATGPACLSFSPSKNLGAWGDGGMVLSDDPDLVADLRARREHGGWARGPARCVGVNSRLDAIQAAVLQVKLRHLARHDAARHRVAGALLAGLEGLVGLELPAAPRPHDAPSSFTLRVTDGRRDALASALHDAGIESRVYYPRLLADEPTCAQARRLDDLVTARRLTAQVLTIPSHAYLDDGQIDRIIGAIRSHFPAGS